jgi:hypothetical protein
MKPYQVWCKQCDGWRCLYATDDPIEAHLFAWHNIHHGNNVQRVEVRDLTGVLETVYDEGWQS